MTAAIVEHSRGDGDDARKTKVFVSYSRKDMAFADRLEAALKPRGVEVLIDRSEIYAFEDWWKRIEALVAQADTVVFVLSPDSASSEICSKEIAFAVSLNKRLAPIVCRRVDDKAVPDALARLNFIFFEDDASFEASLEKLVEALTTDIAWVRKHTELGEAARRWTAAGRPRGLLLGLLLLAEAEHWIASRPQGAPVPTDDTQAFIAEGRRAAKRRRNLLTSSLAVGLLLALGLAGLAYWQRGIAVEQEAIAVEQRAVAERNEAQAKAERDRALLTQSRFLADVAGQRMREGDAGSAALLALEALPDARGVERPYASEAEVASYGAHMRRQEEALVRAYTYPVTGVAFSPDGRYVATASEDGSGEIRDIKNGRTTVIHSQHGVYYQGKVVGKVGSPPHSAVRFSPDGTRLLMAFGDNTAQLWDPTTGREIRVFRGHPSPVLSAAFSPDGQRVVTGSVVDAKIWDAETGRELASTAGHLGDVTGVAFSPDGKVVATASKDSKLRIWDPSSAKLIRFAGIPRNLIETPVRIIQARSGLSAIAFSPDGRHVAGASSDRSVQIWNVETAQEVRVLQGHAEAAIDISFSPDGRRLASASVDGSIRIWDVGDGSTLAVLRGHNRSVESVAFSPDGRRLVSGSLDGTARIWHASMDTATTLVERGELVHRAAFSPDGQSLAFDRYDRTVVVLDLQTRKRTAVLDGHIGSVRSLAFSRDGHRVIAALSAPDKTARVWDLTIKTGRNFVLLHGHADGVLTARFSPDGKRVVTASEDKSVRIWDASNGRELLRLALAGRRVLAADFSPDGRRVATAGDDVGNGRIWDAGTGEEIVTFGSRDQSRSVAFSPDGRHVATESIYDHSLHIWDSETGAEIRVLRGHTKGVRAVAFSSDGRRIVTTGDDKTARIWDAQTGQTIAVLEVESIFGTPTNTFLTDAAFSPDGSRVMTVEEAVRIWPIFPSTQALVDHSKEIAPRCLTRDQREKAFLDPEPPAWCIEMAKWPYHTQDWKDWLKYKRANANPPLPDTPQWQAWIAARR